MVKVDETTVRWGLGGGRGTRSRIIAAGDTAISAAGQAVRQAGKSSFGAYSPAHYLKLFLPK